MSNRKQRERNRENARALADNAVVCPECGQRGKHWVSTGWPSLADVLAGNAKPHGFWVCPKFYGPDGRRISS